MNYDMGDNLLAEQHNTLMLIDDILGKQHLKCIPKFEILGGTGLLFHGVEQMFTVDIDTANRISDNVKELVTPFISDNASEVVKLASGYEKRLVPYPRGKFEHCEVYILSLEDIVITKLYSYRTKDREDLKCTDVLTRVDMSVLHKIISTEFEADISRLLDTRLQQLQN